MSDIVSIYSAITFILIVWFAIAFLDYGEFCALWQLKEYRLDRFRDFLSTRQGKEFLKGYLVGGRFAIFCVFLILGISKVGVPLVLIMLVLMFEAARYSRKFFNKKLVFPQRTAKALAVVFLSVAVEFAIGYFSTSTFVPLEIFGIRFLLIALIVFLVWIPTKIVKGAYVGLAKKKMRKYPQLKVVGVTGSYGKTTVKNFLQQILGTKFSMVATPKNINTEIGVAKFILSADFSKNDIFVVEMGAYKTGEIEMICNMVQPQIGILTAINEQHLSLFGSLEKIQQAKYELLRSLPKDGLAITNSDNKYCREFLGELACEVKTFGAEKENNPNLFLSKMETLDDLSTRLQFETGEEEFQASTNVPGKHNVFNIAPCILVARYLGMEMGGILQACKNLNLPKGTLKIGTYGKSIIIDDSYNANPDGFLAALEVLGKYPTDYKKIVITRGMLELGDESSRLHQQIGRKIAECADELLVISGNNLEDLKNGVGKNKTVVLFKTEAQEILEYVRQLENTKAVLLIENRVPQTVMDEINKK